MRIAVVGAGVAGLGLGAIPVGLVVFYAACRVLRVTELDLASRALAGPLLRWRKPNRARQSQGL